jgi:hypothetical protein
MQRWCNFEKVVVRVKAAQKRKKKGGRGLSKQRDNKAGIPYS